MRLRNWQKAVLEAALFQQREPASLPRLARLLQAPPDHVLDVITELQADLRASHRGLEIRTVNGKFQLAAKPECLEEMKAAGDPFQLRTPLSAAALETLALIAYFQPVTAAEIRKNRQVKTAGVLETLLQRKLIRIAGSKKTRGNPALYKTTDEFLIEFRIKSLAHLPPLENFQPKRE